jgi:hypothetical protein
MHNAEAILKMSTPGELYSQDEQLIKIEFRNLAKQWHPDVNTDKRAAEVLKKIKDLYDSGIDMMKAGNWTKPNYVQFRTTDGKRIGITYQKVTSFELGTAYICNQGVIYLVKKAHKRFLDNFVKRIGELKFANDAMKSEFSRCVPAIAHQFETEDHFAIRVSKTADVFSLRDVHMFYKGNLPDRHMTWILRRLYNLACFLGYNKLAHYGLTLDNVYISPQYHTALLFGGWWYATPYGESLLGAHQDVVNLMSPAAKKEKIATHITDLESIRQIGRELVGDKYGSVLAKNTTIPKPIIDWLLGASVKTPLEEYKLWDQTIDHGYGKRQFVEMDVSATDLYPA